jgi:CubicO group peptidase (beta-lactamase class C family)
MLEIEGYIKEKIENMVAAMMVENHVPGLSLAVVKDDQIIFARGFGSRNLKENLPATPETLYGIGSCTKSFTALAIMQLVERGKLDVNDPVSKHLPQFKLKGKNDRQITIHHLLTHSSGIPNLGTAEILIRRIADLGEYFMPLSSVEDFFLHINGAQEEITVEPGERFYYFNEGYTLLGMIVERLSGMSYENYVQENILKPLKMNRSTFDKEKFEKDPDVMVPYIVEVKESEIKAIPSVFPSEKFVNAAGGLLSSVAELAHYLIANMNGGIFENTRILNATLLSQMFKPYIKTGYYWLFNEEAKYGYGWMITENFFGHKIIEHGGNTGSSSAELAFIPDQKIGVAVASNADAGGLTGLISVAVIALMLGKEPEKDVPSFKAEKIMKTLAGEYTSYKGIHKVSVVKKGGLLYLESTEKFFKISAPLIPEKDDIENMKFYIFEAGGIRLPVEFEVGPKGEINMYLERNRFHKVKSA